MNDQFWKSISASLLAIVVAMVGFWLTHAQYLTSREEVIQLMNSQSPYVQDRRLLTEQSIRNGVIGEHNTKMITGLQIEVAKLDSKFNLLLERLDLLVPDKGISDEN